MAGCSVEYNWLVKINYKFKWACLKVNLWRLNLRVMIELSELFQKPKLITPKCITIYSLLFKMSKIFRAHHLLKVDLRCLNRGCHRIKSHCHCIKELKWNWPKRKFKLKKLGKELIWSENKEWEIRELFQTMK
jgi:hypothetical protein